MYDYIRVADLDEGLDLRLLRRLRLLGEYPRIELAAYTAVFVAGMVYSFAIWRRTWVSFEDTEIVVLRDTWG